MSRKLFYSLLCSLMMLIIFGFPVMGEERTVLGLCAAPFAFSYEKEGADNRSWIVNGLIFVDDSFEPYDISLNGYGGIRFYRGEIPGRFYQGLYGLASMKGVEVLPNDVAKTLGLMGVLGYEGRFGVDSKARFFIEAGLKAAYTFPDQFAIGFTYGAGVGFGI